MAYPCFTGVSTRQPQTSVPDATQRQVTVPAVASLLAMVLFFAPDLDVRRRAAAERAQLRRAV